jgi:endonuclease/exonuclease/phosphatase family metal-dependent hydrolase
MLAGVDANLEPIFEDIRIEDHDVILARGDVITSNPVEVNYQAQYVVDEELGLVVPRGYVAVEAEAGEISLVFANTHLESVSDIELRLAQAEELLNAFAGEESPVIIVGDFNSQAPDGDTYTYVLDQNYTDIWDSNPLNYNTNGYTFGHRSDLRNDDPRMFTRIDFIFVGPQSNPQVGNSFVLGDEKRDKTSSGMWPSDHAGVVSILTFPLPAKLVAN